MTNYIVDGIIILILLIGTLIGLKKGLVETVAKPIKVVTSFAIALSTSSLLNNNLVKNWFYNPVSNKLTSYLTEKCADLEASSASENLPTLVKLVAKMSGLDVENIGNSEESTAEVITTVVEAVSDPLASAIGLVVSFLMLYVSLRFLFWIVFKLVDVTVDFGFVGFVNKLLGCIFTLAISFIGVWVICLIFNSVLQIPALAEQAWVQEFSGGVIYKFFKELNPIDLLLSF